MNPLTVLDSCIVGSKENHDEFYLIDPATKEIKALISNFPYTDFNQRGHLTRIEGMVEESLHFFDGSLNCVPRHLLMRETCFATYDY